MLRVAACRVSGLNDNMCVMTPEIINLWLGHVSEPDMSLKRGSISFSLLLKTPGWSGTHLAAMNAPRIIVNTVSCTGRENVFLSKVREGKAMKPDLCANKTS